MINAIDFNLGTTLFYLFLQQFKITEEKLLEINKKKLFKQGQPTSARLINFVKFISLVSAPWFLL